MLSFDSDHPYRSLPQSPDSGRLREEAKLLKLKVAQGDAGPIAFVNFHQPSRVGAVQLADAQFALARSYGFKSWPRLKAFAEAQSVPAHERGALLLRTLFNDNFALLEELYARRESLTASNIFIAAALGNLERVKALLAENPACATQIGGPLQTQAVTYAAYARFALLDDSYLDRQREVVALLLAHDADPNSFITEESRGNEGDRRLSALYGCCKQPGNPTIAKLLLDAGASPNDGESLYHASELRDPLCLELLFAAGVKDADRDYCIRRALDQENPEVLGVYLKNGANPSHLDYALFRNRSLPIIALLIEHGADLNRPCDEFWLLERIRELKPIQVAERAGRDDAVSYLLSKGADDVRTPRDRLIGACARQDETAVSAILLEHPDIARTLTGRDHSNIATLARAGQLESVELMLDAGFNIDARADDLDATGLHYAASRGDVPMVRLLLARGARLDLKHKYGGTPLGTAIYCAASFPDPGGSYTETVQLLAKAGEPATDEQLKFAIEHSLDDIAAVLKSHGVRL
jgi:ankyrin repeat protein